MYAEKNNKSSNHKKILKSDSVINRNPKQVFSIIDSEVIMLNIRTGEYYSLNSTASAIWNHLASPCIYEDLINTLTYQYEVDYDTCRMDIDLFLNEMIKSELIIVD
jgi:hypothetical protein